MCQTGDENNEEQEDEDEDNENHGDHEDDDRKEMEKDTKEKFFGIRLYARFHSYYEGKTKNNDSLEGIHLKILEKLNDFSLKFNPIH